MKHHSMSSKAKDRRLKALSRLQIQLKTEVKNFGNHISGGTVSLTATDKLRIEKEILTLKTRV